MKKQITINILENTVSTRCQGVTFSDILNAVGSLIVGTVKDVTKDIDRSSADYQEAAISLQFLVGEACNSIKTNTLHTLFTEAEAKEIQTKIDELQATRQANQTNEKAGSGSAYNLAALASLQAAVRKSNPANKADLQTENTKLNQTQPNLN